ncbi:hypothetical protein [Paenibacillus contaminans]|uniref:Uncharacterized protein n=1 Tax=Paenibacillus contaminans TaxID=450362 RepID=A0A329MTA6_9BACL|nr:hypothetical protein [Paenibacillus contaminans]RAV23185.1 hypothetical protein DQG23_03045 [Paenibacillus contaminans]
MPMPTEMEMSLLFERNNVLLDHFLSEHKEKLKRRLISEEELKASSDENFEDMIVEAFVNVYGVAVDWRDYDEDIVSQFGRVIPQEVDVENTEEGLNVSYDGENFVIKLSFSPKDRYITVRGFQSIVRERYELRLFESSYMSDTHVFMILPKETWADLDRRFPEKVLNVFRKIDDDLDFP